jgi:DNA-directed RNA polymerase subunit RPC12/RpoP
MFEKHTIKCTSCSKEVERDIPVSEQDDNSVFVCEECAAKRNEQVLAGKKFVRTFSDKEGWKEVSVPVKKAEKVAGLVNQSKFAEAETLINKEE